MPANPLLKRLGLNNTDRVVLFHLDDLGMCNASLLAYKDLVTNGGLISTAGIMAPCAWFPSVAALNQDLPGADLGVHATLNCEWASYRWAPLSGVPGLKDAAGYLPAARSETGERASADDVRTELRAQARKILAAGIDATHMDTHMGTVFHPKFAQTYIEVALEFGLPPMLPRLTVESALARYDIAEMGVTAAQFEGLLQQMQALEAMGVPMLDSINTFPLESGDDRLPILARTLGELSPGVHYYYFHAAVDTPELRAITPGWQGRVADYACMRSDAAWKLVEKEDIHVMGWRPIRDAMRMVLG